MPGLRLREVVAGQRSREVGGGVGRGAWDRWEQPTHHHLLLLALGGQVLVVGVGGRQWGSDLVQQGALAIQQSFRGPVASEEDDGEPHCQHQEQQQHGQNHSGRAHRPAALFVHLDDDHLRLLLRPLVRPAARRGAAHPVPQG